MEFMKGLQDELQKNGKNIEMEETVLEISPADIVKLNSKISKTIEDDRIMLESSPSKAARFACSK